ncbi:hypothetical protein LCGC14_1911400 [marine sediment metagenome]|uniref:Phage portal protein n=1 Tax=marine sediment metagenome TaxID=412755 RepID=A0A0F9IRK8_9ZZZZ
MTILDTMRRGVSGMRASVTLDNLNLSQDFAGGRVLLVGDKSATYEQIYRSQLWINVMVNKLSRGIGRLPLKSYIAGGEPGERERVREGPLADLLARPFEGGSPFDFKSAIIGNLCLYGNAIAVKMRPRPGQPPAELLPPAWGFWTIQPGTNRRVDWYWFNSLGGQRIPFRPEEVIHWKYWAPGRGLEGISPLEPLKDTIKLEDAARRTVISSYEHGARPVGGYSVPGTLKEETALRLREQLNETYGGVDNAYKILLMEGGAKWESMSHSLVDSDVIPTMKLTREEAAAVFDIPPPIVGILDRATFSNITEQHLMLYMDTMGPPLTMFEETLQVQLIDQEPQMAGQFVEFELAEVLKGDVQKRYDAYNKAQWWMTPNEVRARENLPPKDDLDADSLHTPLNTRSEEDESPPPAQALLPEARCPGCDRILARDVLGATIRCRDCKNEARFGASI